MANESVLSRDILHKLAAPFEPSLVHWKPQALSADKTRALATCYVDARVVMDRLDIVVGGDWSFDWEPLPGGEVKGILTVCGVTRADVGERGSGDFGDTLKAAVSDALKRAAVHFGVARYLYDLPAQWVGYDARRKRLTEIPRLPAWAMPEKSSDDQDSWTVDAKTRRGFWDWTHGELGLSRDEVLKALGVAALKDFGGGKADAKRAIERYIAQRATQEVAP